MSKFYLGIDPSLNATGICVMDSKHEVQLHMTINPKGKRGCERLEFIQDSFRTCLNSFESISAVAIEGYSFGSFNGRERLGELGGILRLELFKRHIDYLEVPPPTLKKYVTGKGTGDKNKILLEVFKKWGISCQDDDQADSYALARLCCAMHEKEKLLAYEQEVINKLSTKEPHDNRSD